MGRHWDSNKGGRAQWVAWLTEITRECLRALKPGGHALFWALPRTSHWTATAVEDGGFEVRDVIVHFFGSGMPHSRDASKSIDKKLGTTAQREVYATYTAGGNAGTSTAEKGGTYGVGVANSAPVELTRTLGGSPEARRWDGWGTGLKPSSEHWILARKSLDGTLADNLLRHGAGALNVDGCRIVTDWDEPDRPASWRNSAHSAKPEAEKIAAPPGVGVVLHPGGRWPPNAVFTHSQGCSPGACAADCPVRILEAQSGELRAGNHPARRAGMGYESTSRGNGSNVQTNAGSAARFFPCFNDDADPFLYQAKASTAEREAGCDLVPPADSGRRNDHATVKSVKLMRWLVRLVTPPGGLCLDVFCGSGSTGVAAVLEGFHFMGFELDERFCEIARARIQHWLTPRTA